MRGSVSAIRHDNAIQTLCSKTGMTSKYIAMRYTCKSPLCCHMPLSASSSSEAEAVSHHRRRITSSRQRHLVERHFAFTVDDWRTLLGASSGEKLLSSARIDVHKDEKLSCCRTKSPTSFQTTSPTLFALAACLASFFRGSSAVYDFVTLLHKRAHYFETAQ